MNRQAFIDSIIFILIVASLIVLVPLDWLWKKVTGENL